MEARARPAAPQRMGGRCRYELSEPELPCFCSRRSLRDLCGGGLGQRGDTQSTYGCQLILAPSESVDRVQ